MYEQGIYIYTWAYMDILDCVVGHQLLHSDVKLRFHLNVSTVDRSTCLYPLLCLPSCIKLESNFLNNARFCYDIQIQALWPMEVRLLCTMFNLVYSLSRTNLSLSSFITV